MESEGGFYRLIPKQYSLKKLFGKTEADEIIFRHGHIAITNYHMGDNREFEKSLSVFDEINWKYELKGGYYVKKLKEFRVNRGYDTELLRKFFPRHHVSVDNDAYPADKIDSSLLVGPRDDFQRVALTFMCAQGEYKSNSRYTQQIIDADTGDGKTYCGVAASCYYHARAVIIVPFGKLLEQWKASFLNFSMIKEKQILIVKGSKLCQEIREGKHHDKKVFIFSADTIDSYQKKHGDLAVMDMFHETNAYLKIVDEIHRDMKAVSMIEALCNFRLNFYMSASPGRSDKKENWIFRSCFKNIPRFGAKFKVQSEKHINVMIKGYRFTPDAIQMQSIVNKRKGWLNTKAYETELIHAPEQQQASFNDSMLAMLRWSKKLLKPENKILILTSTIEGTKFIQSLAEQVFPGETSIYYGGMKPKEKEEALTFRIICATASSLGTGADIVNVQHVYNITTYSNWIDATQLPGRARKLKDGTSVFYIELVNFGFIKTVRQYEKRKPYLIKKSRAGKLLVVD